MIKTVIFDLDGTLADTLPDLQRAMNRMLRTLSLPEVGRADILAAINHGSRYFVQHCLPVELRGDDALVDRAHELYHKAYSENYCVETRPYDGMPEVISALSRRYSLGVLSNKRTVHVREIIRVLFSDLPRERFDPGCAAIPPFASVWGQSELPTKPDPAGALRVMAETGVSPDETVFIGDSDIDMKTAVAAGFYPLGVLWGYRGRDALTAAGARSLASSPAELPAIIAALE